MITAAARRLGPCAAMLMALGGCADDDQAVIVFAAASLTDVADAAASAYTDDTGVQVELVVGGSSTLAAQIRDGAPVDVFLSADESHATAIECDRCTPLPFASNTAALVVPPGNPGSVTSLADLTRPELDIVMCAPEVPCGALSAAALEGLDVKIDSFERDVRAVLRRVELDEADAGIVYRTDVAEADVTEVRVAELDELTAHYWLVVIHPDRGDAMAFADFLVSGAGRAILVDAGFGPP